MKRIIYIICLVNFIWGIGLDALIIPQKANIIAMSGAGIASNLDIAINPSSKVRPYLGFSNNNWLAGVSGQKSTWIFEGNTNYFLSFESLGVDDIEYHSDNNPNPEGYISANWYAIDFGSNFNINKYFDNRDVQLGYNLKLNYSKLYVENSWGYTLDLGFNKEVVDDFNIGFVIKNLGKQYYSSQEDIKINHYIGVGISHKLNIVQANKFYFDLVYNGDVVNNDDNNILKIGLMTKFPYLNLMLGTSQSEGYNDLSYGLSVEVENWVLIFGNLNHENSALGTPRSIELRKYFN